MVWWGVLYFGAIQFHFCDSSVKTNGDVYWAMLNHVLLPLAETVFADEDKWRVILHPLIKQKKKKIQKWLQEYVPDFIEANDWPFFISDLNSLD